ncbi:MAG: HAD family hydrolase [Planctomycetes bacterium RBG_13_60_9]|nr:MAG: HAD family hydrolase [Planctomycetes bacterium RBG_13_60_9]
METLRSKRGFICDMDGVIYQGSRLLDASKGFVEWLKTEGKRFLFLTNSSARSPRELHQRLLHMGIEVGEDHFITSGMATAHFIAAQCPGGRVYAIGDSGLYQALYEAGLSIDESKPDYVVVGETRSYSYEKIETAVLLVLAGAKLIGTNPDLTGPTEKGIGPACRALIAPIEMSTGRQAYFVGKPNPLIMRHALELLGCRREETAIIGDRMDTDIVAGIESGIDTALVLSGITKESDIARCAYKPHHILKDISEISG